MDCWVRVDKESVREARFEVFGGPEAMQAAAWLADWLADRSVASALTVTGRWLAEAAALPDEARTVALDIEDALRSALAASTEVIDGANDEH
ncbi:nitrogen fixation NifU-like protein [Spiribacter vilamensis]|uniref:Nitrogen fixation NifU-like protein n=1 Tax=Spiribacter vilamensis TaxID=531306 RepID=A0A4Q8D0R2_9GAMM|nr:nitrogen fixation NifU-like protein [Spiribacter vilamensis]